MARYFNVGKAWRPFVMLIALAWVAGYWSGTGEWVLAAIMMVVCFFLAWGGAQYQHEMERMRDMRR